MKRLKDDDQYQYTDDNNQGSPYSKEILNLLKKFVRFHEKEENSIKKMYEENVYIHLKFTLNAYVGEKIAIMQKKLFEHQYHDPQKR